MEDNNLGPKKVQDVDAVNLIDPNPSDNGIYSPEDYSIFVEFSATPRSRSAIIQDGDNIDIDSSVSLGKINFVGTGTDFGSDRKEKHQSSYYTEIGTNFGDGNEDLETLGITNINIDFNSSYTPLIKIDFVDVRGRLFEQQAKQYFNERKVNKPINDVFFRQPYPLFYLKIKGFYGKPVTYCLHLTKFNSRFNNETGNLEITTEYIGYTYAFLSDMLMGLVRGASELSDVRDCIKERRFEDGAEMLTISELQARVLDLNSELKRVKARSSDLKLLENQDKTKEAILRLKQSIPDILRGTFEEGISGIIFKNLIKEPNRGLFVYVGENIGTLDFSFNDFEINRSSIISDRFKKFKDSEFEAIKKEFGEIKNIEQTKESFNLKEGNNIITSVTTQTFLKTIDDTTIHVPSKLKENDGELFYKIRETLKEQEYDNKENIDVIIVDLSTPILGLNDLISDFNEQVKNIQSRVSEEIERISKQTFGFRPTIKNFLEVITTNIECFVNKIKDVSDEAYNSRIKGNEDYNIIETLSNQKEIDKIPKGDNTNVNIYPFPEYRIKENDVQVESWVGNRLPNIPEVEFVEELLEAIIRGVKADDDFSKALGGETNQASKIKTWVPINPLDSLPLLKLYQPEVNETELNVWKNLNSVDVVDFSENVTNDLLNKMSFLMLIRGFIFMNHTCKSVSSKEIKIMAELEAYNCFNNIENISFFKRLIGSKYNTPRELYDEMLNIITNRLGLIELENEIPSSLILQDDLLTDRYVLKSENFSDENVLYENIVKNVINIYPSYSIPNKDGLAYGSDFGVEDSFIYSNKNSLKSVKDSVNNKLIEILSINDYESIVNGYEPINYVNNVYSNNNYTINGVTYNLNELSLNFGFLNEETFNQELNEFRKLNIDFNVVNDKNSIKNTFYSGSNPFGTTIYEVPLSVPTDVPSNKILFYFNEHEPNNGGENGLSVGKITKPDGNKNIFYHGLYTVCEKRSVTETNFDISNNEVPYLENDYYGVLEFFEKSRPLDGSDKHGNTNYLLDMNNDVSVPFITFTKTFINSNSPLFDKSVLNDADLKEAYKGLKTNNVNYYSLFGDLLYYNLDNEEDRAIYFLHSLPIKGLEASLIQNEIIGEDESTENIVNGVVNKYFFYDEAQSVLGLPEREKSFMKYNYNQLGGILSDRASSIKVTYSWLLLIGGLIYRYDKNFDTTNSENNWDYLSDIFVPYYRSGGDVRGYHLFNGKININVITNLLVNGNNIDNGLGLNVKKDLDMVVRYLPTNIKNELKSLFINWVNDANGWVKLRNKLEIFESENINNSRQFNISEILSTFNAINSSGNNENIDVNEIRNHANNKINGRAKIKNLENYSVFTITKTNGFSDSIWLEIDFNSELNKDLVSFLREERVLVSTSWRPWSIDNYISKNNKKYKKSNLLSAEYPILKKELKANSDLAWLINRNEIHSEWGSSDEIYPQVLGDLSELSNRNSLYYIPTNSLNSYVESFSRKLYELCNGFAETEQEDEKESLKYQIFGSTDNDTIKLTIYKSIKNIYNKWISGLSNPNNPCFSCDEDENNINLIDKFIFADRALNDIGDDFLINPIGALQYIQQNSNQSFYDFIARLLADNNFDFIPLPTFVNTNDPNEYQDIFKPYQFNEAPGCSGPKFVCVYGGERSSQLDIYEGEYENDGTDVYSPDLPNDFNGKNVFLVKYGQQNQSQFKDIKVSQEEFSETLESLQVTSDIAGDNKGPNNQNYAGQNIFSIYQNRSYSCEVESLGNPNIQPFMHFQLNSIPMFHGLYLITRVKHNITPNYMNTTFNGTRIRRVATPLIDEYTLYMNLLDQLEPDDSNVSPSSGSITGGGINSEDYSIISENNNSIIVSNLASSSVGIKLNIPTNDEIERIRIESKNNSENMGSLFLIPPTQGSVSSGFGFRTPPVEGASSQHKGIDISAPVGQDIISPANGIIDNINPNSDSGGKMIWVNFKNGFVGKFLHMSKISVSKGDEVNVGDKLGEVGATGCCVSGPHLHYELLKDKLHVDPLNYTKTQFT